MELFSLGFYCLLLCIGNLDILENGLKREEEEEREFFLFTPSSRRREKLIKGRAPASMDPTLAKTEGAKVFIFFRLGPQINVRGGRETEKLIIVV